MRNTHTFKIVGFVNLEPKKCLKVYPTKEAAQEAQVKSRNKNFVKDFAASLMAEALKLKLFAAKKALKMFGYSFNLLSKFWTVCKKIKAFNKNVSFGLKVKFN